MPLSIEKLRILTFPQRIAGRTLDVHVLLMPIQRLLNVLDPFQSVLNPGTTVELPKFINANLVLAVDAIRGLGSYPFSNPAILTDGATLQTLPTGTAFPANLPALYEGLATQFKLVDKSSVKNTEGAPAPLADADGIRKYLPNSYRTAFNFTTPRTEFAKTDDSYHCAIKRSPRRTRPSSSRPTRSPGAAWSPSACANRFSPSASGCCTGFPLRSRSDDYFKDGGWVSFRLTSAPADFDIVNADTELRSYAARIPEIDESATAVCGTAVPRRSRSRPAERGFRHA